MHVLVVEREPDPAHRHVRSAPCLVAALAPGCSPRPWQADGHVGRRPVTTPPRSCWGASASTCAARARDAVTFTRDGDLARRRADCLNYAGGRVGHLADLARARLGAGRATSRRLLASGVGRHQADPGQSGTPPKPGRRCATLGVDSGCRSGRAGRRLPATPPGGLFGSAPRWPAGRRTISSLPRCWHAL